MSARVWIFGLLGVSFLISFQAVRAAETINWTFYAPGASGWMQGPMTAALSDASGSSKIIHTLDDVRLGRSPYVTVASASIMKGRWYCIGTVKYTSPIDRQTHTLENVVGYVHDTGCAFNGTCSCEKLPQFCNGQAHPEKMDLPVGNFNGWGADPAMQFVSRNPNSAARVWQQIAGLPTPTDQTSGSTSACGGTPRETGVPSPAPYSPTNIHNPYDVAGSPYTTARPYTAGFPSPLFSPTSIGSPSSIGQTTPSAQSPYWQPSQPESGTTVPPNTPVLSAAMILAQPRVVSRGNPVIISWTSVGMNATRPCRVMIGDTQLLAQGNEGTQSLSTSAQPSGPLTVTLKCQSVRGEFVERSATVTLR